jgi:hypothetical protein
MVLHRATCILFFMVEYCMFVTCTQSVYVVTYYSIVDLHTICMLTFIY